MEYIKTPCYKERLSRAQVRGQTSAQIQHAL